MTENKSLYQNHYMIVIVLFLFSSISCSNDNEVSFFEKELSYTSVDEYISFSFNEIYAPMTIRFIDDKLYVGDLTNPDSPVHVLQFDSDNTSLNYLKGLGRHGQGPGEFLLVNDFIATDSLIYIYDGNQLKLISYDPSSGELAQSDDIHLRTTGRPESIHSIAGGKFVGMGLFFGSRYIIIDSEGESISEYGDLIEFNNDFSRRDIALGWRSFGTAHPKEPYIYLFSMNADFIEKYNIDGQLIKRIQGLENPEPNMEIRDDWPFNIGPVSYLSVDSDEKFIYGLYSGLSRDDEGLSGNIIHKFDLDLNMVNAYQLDQRFFQFAAVGDGNIITFGETDEGIVFYVYKLF